jgi:hypothetical protein
MSTRRKLVSDVRGTMKLLSSDAPINDRVLWSEIFNSAKLLIKRETNLRKLWANDTIFSNLPCFEMEEVPISTCCEYVSECTVSRSKHKLPIIGVGNYQYLIQGVYSINVLGGRGKKLKEITINRYLNLLKLPIIKKEEYYWIVDNYLYCSNPMLKAIRMAAFFEEDIPINILYPDCGCGINYSLDDLCRNPMDLESCIPGYLEKQVLELTSQKLLNTYYRLKTDQTSNNNDGQAPNTTNVD